MLENRSLEQRRNRTPPRVRRPEEDEEKKEREPTAFIIERTIAFSLGHERKASAEAIVVKKGKAPPTDYSALGRSMLALEGGFDAGGYRAPSNSQKEMAVMGRDLRQTLGEIACTS